mmetsp:Transcript_28741/g.37722  ORF Transcript_28741/g.37722 Transcript_28741/m.37722 type:complete len:328 (-) Transcript_28741:417-1400(-)|eukprot:CAMPEP_0117749366 /NCGR_PEP_ID=MMETSP0947-20121206/9691_1 /TAXON_ID=44440 /ORGANISM="Chattonella subsalsa, Strain CCMP2191" /LENGTH=327 /DNA_ID=CAMNT_0005567251 /DNA_START=51 /DNA_END=1034 /DNA_ORIENTATION=+
MRTYRKSNIRKRLRGEKVFILFQLLFISSQAQAGMKMLKSSQKLHSPLAQTISFVQYSSPFALQRTFASSFSNAFRTLPVCTPKTGLKSNTLPQTSLKSKVGDHAVKRTDFEILPGKFVPILQVIDPDPLLDQAINEGEVDPYGAILWPSSIAASKVLTEWNEWRKGQKEKHSFRLLEIGAGTGLVSLTALHFGGHVLATDVFSYSLELIEAASKLPSMAKLRGRLETAIFDVTSNQPLPSADIMVVSDLLYDRDIARTVAQRVWEASSRGISSIVADPGREGRKDFLDELKKKKYFADHYFHSIQVQAEENCGYKNVGVLVDFPSD